MVIMILGGAGMLGFAVREKLQKENYQVITVGRKNCDYNIDCTNFFLLDKIIKLNKPSIIINCIAVVDLNKCEKEKKLANKTHIELPKYLSSVKNIRNIYISTDSVYSGECSSWKENDEVSPANYYALSKLQGERVVLESNGIVLRTNLYGVSRYGKKNSLFEWVYSSLKENKTITGYSNVFFNPLSNYQLAEVLYLIIKKIDFYQTGIINLGCKESISKYDFCLLIANAINSCEKKVNKGILDNSQAKMKRSLNTILDTSKMKMLLEIEYSVIDGIHDLVNRRLQ